MELVQTEHFWEENKEQLHESEQSINLCPRTWYNVLNIYCQAPGPGLDQPGHQLSQT